LIWNLEQLQFIEPEREGAGAREWPLMAAVWRHLTQAQWAIT